MDSCVPSVFDLEPREAAEDDSIGTCSVNNSAAFNGISCANEVNVTQFCESSQSLFGRSHQ